MRHPSLDQEAAPDRAPWLEAALAYLGAWLEFQVRHSATPGCAVAVAQDGELLWERAYGRANLSMDDPLMTSHRFRMASLSKSFTAVGVLKLLDAGRLRLDDRAGAFVPGLHPKVAGATLVQLLSHSAGLSRDGSDASYFADLRPFPSRAEVLAELQRPPVIEPGTRFKYSNYGYALLSLVIEAVAGESYREWISREVIGACALAGTTPDLPLDLAALAVGHTGALPTGRFVVPGRSRTEAFACVTGLTATTADMARFYGRLAPGVSESPLSEACRREMTRPHWRDVDSDLGRAYGLGAHVGQLAGWEYFGHVGRFQGVVSRALVIPEVGVSLALVTNAVDGPAVPWVDGAVRILRRFHDEGAPSQLTRGWTSRWWSLWGPLDLVAVGDKVLGFNPGDQPPFGEAIEITLDGADTGFVSRGPAMDRYGESVERRIDRSDRPDLLRIGSAAFGAEALVARRIARQYGAAGASEGKGRQ